MLIHLFSKKKIWCHGNGSHTRMQSCKLWSHPQQTNSLNHFHSLKGSSNRAMMKRTWWTIVSSHWLSLCIIKCPEGFHLKKEGRKSSGLAGLSWNVMHKNCVVPVSARFELPWVPVISTESTVTTGYNTSPYEHCRLLLGLC